MGIDFRYRYRAISFCYNAIEVYAAFLEYCKYNIHLVLPQTK